MKIWLLYWQIYDTILVMLEYRKNPRFCSSARASISGLMDNNNTLKDISITGCCVEADLSVNIQPDVSYELEIIPEAASEVKNFILLVEQKWKRPGEKSNEIGFVIVASPKGKQFQHYIDYLAYRNSTL